MRILHTADWHIGQLFYEHDRTYEHQCFLDWLINTVAEEQVDVLLISGDVFDQTNPSAQAIHMFYKFLNEACKARQGLQIIVTAGNHDSAGRLESARPLLESSNIRIVGLIDKDAEGNCNFDKLLIPLGPEGQTQAWCMAVPFLRTGDYPVLTTCENPYEEGVRAFYSNFYNFVKARNADDLPVIAMGHLQTRNAELSDLDKAERLIMGGIECVPASAFHPDIRYVALGHIHKAQKIGGTEHIRYCGSPLPMSFSERNYRHQVLIFNLNGDLKVKSVEIPAIIPLLRSPEAHRPLTEVIQALLLLPDGPMSNSPYLEVRVLLERPEPSLRHQIEQALAGKACRLTRIDVRYPSATGEPEAKNDEHYDIEKFQSLKPLQILNEIYAARYQTPAPAEIISLFNEASQQAIQKDQP